MKVFDANINSQVSDFLNDDLKNTTTFDKANERLYKSFCIKEFFENDEELEIFKKVISHDSNILEEADRAEYGDFQTNANLSNKITSNLSSKGISPEIIIEPTCGKGNLIIASLCNFKQIKHVFGIEIYKPYVWETKFNIINFFLDNPNNNKPEILISHSSVFDFNFKHIANQYYSNKILIIGNPPWVTNSKLGSLNSKNLPKKSNFKNHSGLDAITGKGNFDIAEFITLTMIDAFQKMN